MADDGPWAQGIAQATAALYAGLEPAVEQTVYGAIMAATGSPPTAGAIAPPAAKQFAAAFAPAYTEQSLAAFRIQITKIGIAAGGSAVAIFLLAIGTLLWTWAIYDRRRPRAYLMFCGAFFGIVTGCLSLYLNLRPDKVSFPYIVATAVFGAINIVCMLVSNIYSATLFWSNAKHRGIYQAIASLTLSVLAILSIIFISVDIVPCGYTYCTGRTRYIIPTIPLLYVIFYLGMWAWSIWSFVFNTASGNNRKTKQVIRTLY